MLENYEIIAPNKRPYATATTWSEACDIAVDLSLKWGVLFRVRRLHEAQGTFQKERLKVLERSLEYIELARKWPKSLAAEKARIRFETSKRKLDALIESHNAIRNSEDFANRVSLSHPVKGFRTDI